MNARDLRLLIDQYHYFGIKRNPLKDSGEISKRSEFISTKTHKLRPMLYNFFCKDKSISFLYSDQETRELDGAKIIENHSKTREA